MNSNTTLRPRSRLAGGGIACLLGLSVLVPGNARAEGAARAASVDDLCPWGRLSDGHGKLVRCLTSEEADQLRAPPAAPPRAAPALPVSPAAQAVKVAAPPAGGALPTPTRAASVSAAAPPLAPAPAETKAVPAPSAESPEPPAAPVDASVDVELGPVTADVGALPDAVKSLKKARDKFVECAARSGGLLAEHGDVEVRFLVQERGRAEGVSVKRSRGLSEAAAKCIAGVVDRRYVGYPEAPAVGATLSVSVKKKK